MGCQSSKSSNKYQNGDQKMVKQQTCSTLSNQQQADIQCIYQNKKSKLMKNKPQSQKTLFSVNPGSSKNYRKQRTSIDKTVDKRFNEMIKQNYFKNSDKQQQGQEYKIVIHCEEEEEQLSQQQQQH